MKIFTIGFTKTTAENFFDRLQTSGARRVVDVRLNNVSQLAAFAKRDDLAFFLRSIADMDYIHRPELAPTQPILDAYKKHKGDWSAYERDFNELMRARRVESAVPRSELDGACLLCSEDTPEHCHRRLVAEYFHKQWPDVEIVHL